MRHTLLVLAAVALIAVTRPISLAAQTSTATLSGALPASGIGLAVWSGGTPEALRTAAIAKGCTPSAIWLTPGGHFIGYVFGAPSVVNAEFLAANPGSIAANTAVLLVCRAATPASASSATSLGTPVPGLPGDATDRELERIEFAGLNAERTSRGLPELGPSAILAATAAKYAAFMVASGSALSHTADGRQPWERAQAEGYPPDSASEIIAEYRSTQITPPATLGPIFVQMWMDSPPHRAIVLGQAFDGTELGVGCAHGRDPKGLFFVICVGNTGRR